MIISKLFFTYFVYFPKLTKFNARKGRVKINYSKKSLKNLHDKKFSLPLRHGIDPWCNGNTAVFGTAFPCSNHGGSTYDCLVLS
ncbi:MAG: hypothetical protein RSC07_01710, partial [Mucinivorans sp.]